jgi:hypothetical protein
MIQHFLSDRRVMRPDLDCRREQKTKKEPKAYAFGSLSGENIAAATPGRSLPAGFVIPLDPQTPCCAPFSARMHQRKGEPGSASVKLQQKTERFGRNSRFPCVMG